MAVAPLWRVPDFEVVGNYRGDGGVVVERLDDIGIEGGLGVGVTPQNASLYIAGYNFILERPLVPA